MCIQLHNGDCLTEMEQMANGSVDLILTDPPYNIGQFAKDRGCMNHMRQNYFVNAGWDNESYDQWVSLMNGFFAQASRVLRMGGLC